MAQRDTQLFMEQSEAEDAAHKSLVESLSQKYGKVVYDRSFYIPCYSPRDYNTPTRINRYVTVWENAPQILIDETLHNFADILGH